MVYVRYSLTVRRRPDLELESPVEIIVLDVCINNRKWVVVGAYRPRWVDKKLFSDIVTKGTDKIATQFDNIILLRDLNYDCLDKSKGSTLFDLCDIFDFRNLIKSPTCFTKNFTPSSVDVILTNKPQFCFNTFNFGWGVSDCHNFVGTVVKGNAPRIEKSKNEL